MTASVPTQLTLGVSLDDDARFENFLISDSNRQLVDSLLQPDADNPLVYLWGPSATGLTHLLQAMCHARSEAGLGAIYLPMHEHRQFSPAILEGANTLSLVCIDDLEAIAGIEEWEVALFTAFNQIRESATQLVLASRYSPQNLPLNLADLSSRLQLALVYQLQELDDEEKLRALQLRANRRGIELPRAVAEFILQRSERSLKRLMEVLDRLDASSLQQQRRLTIPLVKSTMDW